MRVSELLSTSITTNILSIQITDRKQVISVQMMICRFLKMFISGAKKHWLLDPPGGRIESGNEREIDGFNNVRGGIRQSSLNAVLDGKHKGKKKPGILKGIGSMFRFGKHRKTETSLEQVVEPVEYETEPQEQKEPEKPQEELRTQEQYQQIPQQVQQMHHHHHRRRQMEHHHHNMIPENAIVSKYHREDPAAPSRSERVHNLRAQHQQRHVERQGHYPSDEREEHYEEVIRQVNFVYENSDFHN